MSHVHLRKCVSPITTIRLRLQSSQRLSDVVNRKELHAIKETKNREQRKKNLNLSETVFSTIHDF